MVAMPHLGQRDVFMGVDGRRTAKDFAACIDHIANNLFPEAEKIILVMDKLNTHGEAALYETFAPEKALALCERSEIHYTRTNGSWLNMAEIERGLMRQTFLDRRVGSVGEFKGEVKASLRAKNEKPRSINWQFTKEKSAHQTEIPLSIYLNCMTQCGAKFPLAHCFPCKQFLPPSENCD